MDEGFYEIQVLLLTNIMVMKSDLNTTESQDMRSASILESVQCGGVNLARLLADIIEHDDDDEAGDDEDNMMMTTMSPVFFNSNNDVDGRWQI